MVKEDKSLKFKDKQGYIEQLLNATINDYENADRGFNITYSMSTLQTKAKDRMTAEVMIKEYPYELNSGAQNEIRKYFDR